MNDLLTLWDSIAAEQNGPELTDVDQQLIDQRLESFLAEGDPGLDADATWMPSSSRSEHGAAAPPASDRWLTLTEWSGCTDLERNR